MLESITGDVLEFTRVKEQYQELRDVLERVLVTTKPHRADDFALVVKKEIEYATVPLEVELTTSWWEDFNDLSVDEKLKRLSDFTISVGVEARAFGVSTKTEVPATSTLIPKSGRLIGNSTTYKQARDIVKHLKSLSDLLGPLPEN